MLRFSQTRIDENSFNVGNFKILEIIELLHTKIQSTLCGPDNITERIDGIQSIFCFEMLMQLEKVMIATNWKDISFAIVGFTLDFNIHWVMEHLQVMAFYISAFQDVGFFKSC